MVGINYKTGLSLSPERKCVFTGNMHDLVSIGTTGDHSGDILVSLAVIKYIAERELRMQEINSGQIDSLLNRAAAAEHTSIQLMSSELQKLAEVKELLAEILVSPLVQFSAAAVKEKFPTQKEIMDTLIVKSEPVVEPDAPAPVAEVVEVPEHREPAVVVVSEETRVEVPVVDDIKKVEDPELDPVKPVETPVVPVEPASEPETVEETVEEAGVDGESDDLTKLLAGLEK